MFVSGGVNKIGSEWGCWSWSENSSWQWQPTLDTHDPNPPLPLEDPAAAPVTGTLAGSVSLTGAISGLHGTLVTITATWGADTSSAGADGELDGDDASSVLATGTWRWAQKFPTSALVGLGSVLAVTLQVNVVGTSGGVLHDIGPYGTDGTADPEAEASMAARYAACANTGQYANDTPELGTTGIRQILLSATAVSQLQAARATGRWSVTARYTPETDPQPVGSSISEYDAGSNAPQLLVLVEPGIVGTLAGTVTPTGAFTGFRGVAATLSGSLVPTGSIAAFRGVTSTLAGSVAPTGAIAGARGAAATMAGSVSPTGAISGARGVAGALAGSTAPTGSITGFRGESGTLAGSVAPTGAFAGTHSAAGVSGTLAGVISLVGDFRGKFKSSRAAAVKHYPVDDSEPEVPHKLRQPRRRKVEQPEPRWEMPGRQANPLPYFELRLPEIRPIPPLPAPAPPPLPEPEPEPLPPPDPVVAEMAGSIELYAEAEIQHYTREQFQELLAEDDEILSTLLGVAL